MSARLRVESISGFPEWLPNLRLQEEQWLATIREQYQLYGFTPIETPAVERMEVLTAKGGLHQQIFTVGKPAEREADVGLGLHFDLTVPLARYVVQYADRIVFPFRRYQIQKVWRGERAQKGRFREFYQCDVDIIGRGELDLIHDAEIPCVINATFEALRLPAFQVHVSNRKILGDLINVAAVGPTQLVSALRGIDKTHREGIEKTRETLLAEGVEAKLISPILDLIQCERITEARHILQSAKASLNGLAELEKMLENALALGMPESRICPNFSIARGLDYYREQQRSGGGDG